MSSICSKCNGTTRCPQCKGTGKVGYPGFGNLNNYKDCPWCHASGVCYICRGKGQTQ